MGNCHRKKPFSGKQKKKQLKAKRARNNSKKEEGVFNYQLYYFTSCFSQKVV